MGNVCIGTTAMLSIIAFALISKKGRYVPLAILQTYGKGAKRSVVISIVRANRIKIQSGHGFHISSLVSEHHLLIGDPYKMTLISLVSNSSNIEKNKPATWTFPLWSARGDLTLWTEVITGRRAF